MTTATTLDQVEVFLYVFLIVFIACCCIYGFVDLWRESEERNAAELAVLLEQAWMLAVEEKLGYFPYSVAVEADGRGASRERQLECVICLEVFVHGAMCSEVPACRHLFHQECIALWMRSKSTCPLCRANIVPGLER